MVAGSSAEARITKIHSTQIGMYGSMFRLVRFLLGQFKKRQHILDHDTCS